MLLTALALAAALLPDGQGNMVPRSAATAAARHTLCVITRSRDAGTLLADWVPHYLAEGAGLITIIDDRSVPSVEEFLLSRGLAQDAIRTKRVDISTLPADDQGLSVVSKLARDQRDECEWITHVDTDEFIFSRRSANDTIAHLLQSEFSAADRVLVPWVMFGINGSQTLDPTSVVQENVQRWDHDRHHYGPNDKAGGDRYRHIEGKSIFRPDKLGPSSPSHPGPVVTCHRARMVDGARVVEGVHGTPLSGREADSAFYKNLREVDIASALLTTNHYRIVSLESVERKCAMCQESEDGGHGAEMPGNVQRRVDERGRLHQRERVRQQALKNDAIDELFFFGGSRYYSTPGCMTLAMETCVEDMMKSSFPEKFDRFLAQKRARNRTVASSGWTLNPNECPAGQRNAAASECLAAVQEAARNAGEDVPSRIKHLDDGSDTGVPAGCSYSRVSKAAIFNSNAAGRSSDKYQGSSSKLYQWACMP